MKRKSNSSLGAMHPVLFFSGFYILALFLAFFVCRSVYVNLNEKDDETSKRVVGSSIKYSGGSAALTAAAY